MNKEYKYKQICNDLVNTLIDMCLEDEELNTDLDTWKEIFCRKLNKYGFLELKDGYYIDSRFKGSDKNE